MDIDKVLKNYSTNLTWPDEESGAGSLHTVKISMSESTAKTLKSAFKKPLSNTSRLQVRKAYAFLNVEDTKCPELDHVIKQNLTKDVQDADSNAARLHDGWAICLLSCTNWCRKHSFHLVGTPF